MNKKLLYIYNPNAGKGLILPKLHEVIDVFVKEGYDVEIYPTQGHKDAEKRAAEAGQNYDIIVCSGGDGTLDEVVNGLVKNGNRTPIGYIPVGTTNDYASSLKISKEITLAAHEIMLGTPHPLDVGGFNENIFVYVAAFGLFTGVSYETDQYFKRLFGHMAYLMEGIMSLTDVKSYKMKIEIDGVEHEGDFIYGMVTNSKSVGGFKHLTGPNVELDDGLFEVTFIRMPKNLIQLNEITTSLLLQDNKSDMIISGKAKRVKVVSEGPVAWTMDGEFGGNHEEVVIENIPHAMQILLVNEEKMEEEATGAKEPEIEEIEVK